MLLLLVARFPLVAAVVDVPMMPYDDDLLTFLAKLRPSNPDPLGRALIAGVKEGMQEPATEITRSDKEVEDE